MNRIAKMIGLAVIGTALVVPVSFADVAKPVPANAVVATAVKIDTKFSVEGSLIARKGNVLTIKDKTGMQFNVDISKLKDLKGFNGLALKNGAKIKVNCDYSKMDVHASAGYSVSLTTVESAPLSNVVSKPAPVTKGSDTTAAITCVPAQTIAVKMTDPILLDYVASIEVGNQTFKF